MPAPDPGSGSTPAPPLCTRSRGDRGPGPPAPAVYPPCWNCKTAHSDRSHKEKHCLTSVWVPIHHHLTAVQLSIICWL